MVVGLSSCKWLHSQGRVGLNYALVPAAAPRVTGLTVISKGLLAIAVGTAIAGCPPHRPGRALISASGSYLG
jgi:hypothetical protein